MFVESGTESSGWGRWKDGVVVVVVCVEWSVGVDGVMIAWWRCVCVWGGGVRSPSRRAQPRPAARGWRTKALPSSQHLSD